MSESNGAEGKTLGRKGRMKFRIDDGFPWVTIDVVAVNNQWLDLVDGYRDDSGKIKPEGVAELNQKAVAFVTELLNAPTDEEKCLTLTESLQFVKMVSDETEKLRPFFSTASEKQPSSAGSTELTLSDQDATSMV